MEKCAYPFSIIHPLSKRYTVCIACSSLFDVEVYRDGLPLAMPEIMMDGLRFSLHIIGVGMSV